VRPHAALALCCWLWLPGARAQEVHVSHAADGRGMTVDLRAHLDAPLAVVERIVGDPRTYPRWVPAITSAARDRDAFETRWRLPWPLGEVRERVRMERRALDGGGVKLSWRQVRGDLMRDEGAWMLYPDHDGGTEVHYRATFQLHRWVPHFIVVSAHRRAAFRLFGNLESLAKSPGHWNRQGAKVQNLESPGTQDASQNSFLGGRSS
jgi:hypothetical protein